MDCGHHQTVNKLSSETTKPSAINLLHANALEKLPSKSVKLMIYNHFPSIIGHVCHFRSVRLTGYPDVWGPDKRGPTVYAPSTIDYAQKFTYYAMLHCLKTLPIMFNDIEQFPEIILFHVTILLAKL